MIVLIVSLRTGSTQQQQQQQQPGAGAHCGDAPHIAFTNTAVLKITVLYGVAHKKRNIPGGPKT